MTRSLHPSILAGAVVLGCVTTATSSSTAAMRSGPARPAVQRVSYRPEVVFSSFGEVDFDRDAAVMHRYHGALKAVQSPCVSGERTAREKLEGLRGTRQCPPEEPVDLSPVKVLVDSIPDGIDVANGKIQISEGTGLALVGRMKWEVPANARAFIEGDALIDPSHDGVVRRKKAEIVDELKFLARAASANLVLITFIDEKTDRARGAAGLLFRVDLSTFDSTKNRQGKVPTEI